MTAPKKFQKATIEAALATLTDCKGPRRFLIADEVGLGKTVVAQQVISRMMKAQRKRQLVVFYVCSNLSIAAQNRRKLLEALPEGERKMAECVVDRLTLLPAFGRPTHPLLHLYSLTPDTSIPERGGMRRDGRAQERALLHVLVGRLWPDFFESKRYGRPQDFFRRQATPERWPDYLECERERLRKMVPRAKKALFDSFRRAVRDRLRLKPREWVGTKLAGMSENLEIIVTLRSALAACAIHEIQPDLVIFDEFQRFRDLLDEDIDESASRVIVGLRGNGKVGSPSLMLLSATPYRLFSRRLDDSQGKSHHVEFLELIEFLGGHGERGQDLKQKCQGAFFSLEMAIRTGRVDEAEAHRTRREIQSLLKPLMSRTERSSHPNGGDNATTEVLPGKLSQAELKVYKHFTASLKEEHRLHAVPYWTSIPLPMQTMGGRYVLRRQSRPVFPDSIQQMNQQHRDHFLRPKSWAHPRLRSLLEHLPVDKLALPWLAPSLPWWNLEGPWKGQEQNPFGKMLVFSRFRAVPQAVASLISYTLESHFLDDRALGYLDVTKRRSLSPGADRYPLLALFHPSPWLCGCTDPLAAHGRDIESVKEALRTQVEGALSNLGIIVVDSSQNRPVWRLIAALEEKAGSWGKVRDGWEEVYRQTRRIEDKGSEQERGLGQLLERWHQAQLDVDLTSLSRAEVDRLAAFALSAPGMVVGRALRRHWPEALDGNNFVQTLAASWSGLRTYLDQRLFVKLLSGDEDTFPDALVQAVLNGNLEAVLDEHLWIIRKLHGTNGAELARELRHGLNLRTSHFKLHTADADLSGDVQDSRDSFTLRCHVAMPFTEARMVAVAEDGREQELGLRTDELRRAFNTPFWPHVLTTTSVGQEGLDFHVWCSQLLHWDLCSNPMDLEQREGRIQRFGGIAIRKSIADVLGGRVLSARKSGGSPWEELGSLADAELADESGLQPWWIFKNAAIRRYIFQIPASEQQQRFAWIKEQRLLYRLVLGQPNQEDLLEVLGQREGIGEEQIKNLTIGLSAYFDHHFEE